MKSRKKFHQALKHYCSKNISKAELPRLELTVNGIPVGELQLLPHSKYMSIHNGTGDSLAQAKETDLRKIPTSDFGRKFQEHYGMTLSDNPKLYNRESAYYHRHGKCRWELEDSKRCDLRFGPRTEFGRKFQEHYGIGYADNPNLYNRENYFYCHHGKCRWELEDSKRCDLRKGPKSDFGKKFQEHYGMARKDNLKLYSREYTFYRNHGSKCRWELEDSKRKRTKAKKRPFSDFRLKFQEHYGKTRADDPKLYSREYTFYRNHGRCRWELGFDKPPRNFDFGKKFKEHYGMTYVDTPKLYNREYNYFHRHGKCRWEI